MFYTITKRHIGGRAHHARAPGTPTASVVEDGVAMHDLGSALVPTARLPAVTQGLIARTDRNIGDRSSRKSTHQKKMRPSRAKPYPNASQSSPIAGPDKSMQIQNIFTGHRFYQDLPRFLADAPHPLTKHPPFPISNFPFPLTVHESRMTPAPTHHKIEADRSTPASQRSTQSHDHPSGHQANPHSLVRSESHRPVGDFRDQ